MLSKSFFAVALATAVVASTGRPPVPVAADEYVHADAAPVEGMLFATSWHGWVNVAIDCPGCVGVDGTGSDSDHASDDETTPRHYLALMVRVRNAPGKKGALMINGFELFPETTTLDRVFRVPQLEGDMRGKHPIYHVGPAGVVRRPHFPPADDGKKKHDVEGDDEHRGVHHAEHEHDGPERHDRDRHHDHNHDQEQQKDGDAEELKRGVGRVVKRRTDRKGLRGPGTLKFVSVNYTLSVHTETTEGASADDTLTVVLQIQQVNGVVQEDLQTLTMTVVRTVDEVLMLGPVSLQKAKTKTVDGAAPAKEKQQPCTGFLCSWKMFKPHGGCGGKKKGAMAPTANSKAGADDGRQNKHHGHHGQQHDGHDGRHGHHDGHHGHHDGHHGHAMHAFSLAHLAKKTMSFVSAVLVHVFTILVSFVMAAVMAIIIFVIGTVLGAVVVGTWRFFFRRRSDPEQEHDDEKAAPQEPQELKGSEEADTAQQTQQTQAPPQVSSTVPVAVNLVHHEEQGISEEKAALLAVMVQREQDDDADLPPYEAE